MAFKVVRSFLGLPPFRLRTPSPPARLMFVHALQHSTCRRVRRRETGAWWLPRDLDFEAPTKLQGMRMCYVIY